MTAVYGLVIGLALIVALLGLLVLGLLRSHAEILRRLDSLGTGMDPNHSHPSNIRLTDRPKEGSRRSIGTLEGITPEGEPVVMSPSVGRDPTLLAFLSTSCSSCTPFWEYLNSSSLRFGEQRHRVLVVTKSENEESPTRAQSMKRGDVDVVMSSAAWNDYGAPGAPFFVLIDPAVGVIGEGSASTPSALEEFLTDASKDRGWDRRRSSASSPSDDETRIDADLRDAGILPGDSRLYHEKGDFPEGDTQ